MPQLAHMPLPPIVVSPYLQSNSAGYLGNSGSSIAFLPGFQFVVYEPGNLKGLAEHVQRAAKNFVARGEEYS